MASGHSTPTILNGLQQQQQQGLLLSKRMLESHKVCLNSSRNQLADNCTRNKNSHVPLKCLLCTAGNSRRHAAWERAHNCITALRSAALQLKQGNPHIATYPAIYNIYTTRRLKATSWVLRSLKLYAAHENERHIANKNTWTPQQLVTIKLGVATSMHHTCAHAT